MDAHRSRLPLAIAAVAVAAGAATLLLRPKTGVIHPAAVDATGYFSPRQLHRAADFRDTQRLLGLAEIGLSTGVLALIALRPPRRLRRALQRAGRRPILYGAVTAAGLSIGLMVISLPLEAWQQQRLVDVGLSTQSWGAWLGDAAKSAGIGALFAAVGGALAMALLRRFPRRWWIPGAGVVVLLSVVFVYLAPVVLDPLFNKFTPLPRGPLRSEVFRLAKKSGVDVGQVYRVDASRRTTGANAYVNGLGHTKRVVLYDNLIRDFPRREVASVVAHELGHVKHNDVPRGLLWLAIVAVPATWLVKVLTEALLRWGGWRPSGDPEEQRKLGPDALPALALALSVVSFAVGIASNVLSRRVEASADSFALQQTHDPKAFIDLERRLAISNVAEPDTPGFYQLLFGTHPTTVERIGAGVEWEREHPR
jgi:Zn-dependent protease with chaperone function